MGSPLRPQRPRGPQNFMIEIERALSRRGSSWLSPLMVPIFAKLSASPPVTVPPRTAFAERSGCRRVFFFARFVPFAFVTFFFVALFFMRWLLGQTFWSDG